PSPTGYLHIGGLRTALYNFLLARHDGGTAVLRIEDTDRSRFVSDAEEDIHRALSWAGLAFDEGPEYGGELGPYRQSQRTAHYSAAADELLAAGHAYLAFDTAEDLDVLRNSPAPEGQGVNRYSSTTRMSMKNSLSLDPAEVQRLLQEGTPHVVRLKVPTGETVTFKDIIRGEVAFRSEEIDDQILVKSDGMPTYHLANVVDDHLMGITHVIRGEEWLPSTPKHVLLYQALGWDVPQLAHLPLILSPTGGKLSKRNAASQGIPVLVRDYVEAGFEPEALLNYIALLGWNPGTDRELFDLEDLIREFSLDRVGSSGVQFSMDKLRWFNEQHLRQLDTDGLVQRVRPHLTAAGFRPTDDFLQRVVELMRERIILASDLADADYFFRDPDTFDPKGVAKRWKDDSPALLSEYAKRLEEDDNFGASSAEEVLRGLADELEVGAGRIIHPVRLALSGVTFGPGLFELMEVLGQESSVRRIRSAVRLLA
ncbi:MAG: glutamate--tRNA ligase, partial [Rhodothermales bacterium]|nr:glutamate--tRNA ligase [Rhodothermales bacterium]